MERKKRNLSGVSKLYSGWHFDPPIPYDSFHARAYFGMVKMNHDKQAMFMKHWCPRNGHFLKKCDLHIWQWPWQMTLALVASNLLSFFLNMNFLINLGRWWPWYQQTCIDEMYLNYIKYELCNLTLSQTSPGFYVSAVQVLWKHCGKRRNCS